MHVFVVLFNEPPPKHVIGVAETQFDTYVVSDTAILVGSPSRDPALITTKLGISAEADPPVVGIVAKLNGTYQGYNDNSLWVWLSVALGVSK